MAGQAQSIRFSLRADFVQFSKFSSLGHLSLVELPGIHRIRRQRALLFFCSSGDALDQLMPFHCEFLQHENERFLDEELGITDEKLLHDDQGNVDFCKRFEKWSRRSEPNASEADTSLGPPSLHMETEKLYQDVISWLRERDYEISSPGLREEIRKLVEFHSRLEQDAGIRPGTYTMRNLTEAAGNLRGVPGILRQLACIESFRGRNSPGASCKLLPGSGASPSIAHTDPPSFPIELLPLEAIGCRHVKLKIVRIRPLLRVWLHFWSISAYYSNRPDRVVAL